MDAALVTGIDNELGLRIARKLVAMGYRVYGIGQSSAGLVYAHPCFHPIACDLTDAGKLSELCKQVRQRDENVSLMVHAAWHEPANTLEACGQEELSYTYKTCLESALMCTAQVLPDLIKFRGTLVLVDRSGAGSAGQALRQACAGGLKGLAEGLRCELKDTGVRVLRVEVADGQTNDSVGASPVGLDPQWLVDALEGLLQLPDHAMVTDFVVRPPGSRTEVRQARASSAMPKSTGEVLLPPLDKFPREAEMIETPPRQRPSDAPPPGEMDGDDQDDDDELDRLIAQSKTFLQKEASRHQRDRSPASRQDRDRGPRQADRREAHTPAGDKTGTDTGGAMQSQQRPDSEADSRRGKRRRNRGRRGRRGHRQEADSTKAVSPDRTEAVDSVKPEPRVDSRPERPVARDAVPQKDNNAAKAAATSGQKVPSQEKVSTPKPALTADTAAPKATKKATRKRAAKTPRKVAKKAVRKATVRATKKTARKAVSGETPASK